MKTQLLKILSGAALTMVTLSGCNTTEGLGEDISKAGSAIAGAAHETGNKMSGQEDKKVESKPVVRHTTAHKKAHKHHVAAKKTATKTETKADGTKETTTTETKTETKAENK